ncbi:uncharacterized protein LOC121266869 [Juglans microcarpa x Juglans regia]|uniref:uncharacterized protein LOC121266869 n=1 Tax=Juglans microcarpa x Juglans regia TaxID=2249226 RepID=UPI001B7E7EA0|nr:uncharacterized protein LOC121266869 [Juglans microcarpa x Juglans regia]
MASRKTFHSKFKSIFSTSNDIKDHNPMASDIEFDEADIWSTSTNHHVAPSMENKRTLPISRQPKKVPRKIDNTGNRTAPRASASTSLPLNIPDWSKILKDEYEEHRNRESDEDFDAADDDDESHGNYRLPPHEYLARTRGASLSVHEGIGRTLKGMDLRRVRNAIWKKVGFED